MQLRTLFSPRISLLVVVTGVYGGFVLALADVIARWERYEARSVVVLQFRYAVILLGIVCLAALIWRLRKGPRSWLQTFKSWFPLRLAFYTVALAVAATTWADLRGLLQESSFLFDRFFGSALLAGLGLWAFVLLIRPQWFARPPSGTRGALDVVMFNTVLVIVLLEFAVTVWASNSTSPLFVDLGSARANIERHRPKAHHPYFDFTFNTRGYYDTEFFQPREGDLVIALLADSFGPGVVPYRFNFATVAEQRLNETVHEQYGRIAIHNFGVSAIGMPEYAYLLESEVLAMDPRFVMLAVFVGNDIHGFRDERLRASFANWWVTVLVRRLWLLRTKEEQVANVAEIGAPKEPPGSAPSFFYDVDNEVPTFSEEMFLEIQQKRFKITNIENEVMQRRYRDFFQALDFFHATLGDRLLLVVIPDEFQVNDMLFETLLSNSQGAEVHDRDLPQRLIREYATAKDISLLDLLPPLRAAETRGRTYHLRDTHWNARGNGVAGEKIADFILGQL